MKSKNNRENAQPLGYEDEQLILKVQALVDNELPESEIDSVMASIEGNYRLRDEYVSLLQTKRQLSGLPRLQLRREWYEDFEKKARRKLPMYIGSFFAAVYALWSLLFFAGENLDYALPQWLHITGLFSLTASIISFILNALLQRGTEKKGDRSYKDVLR